MSKVLAAVVASSGATVAAVGGTYLMNRGSDSEQPQKQIEKPDQVSDVLSFTSLQEFKTGKGDDCVKKLFGTSGIDFGNSDGTTNIDGNNKLDDSEFSSSGTGQSTAKSCLVVNWERTNYSSGGNTKWKGYFRGSWSFVNGNKGFTMFVTTKKDSLSLEGGFYLLSNSSGGKVTKYKELDTSLAITKSDFDKRFPKSGTGLSLTVDQGSSTDFGGFVSGADDVEKFCTQSDSCITAATTQPTPLKKSGMGELDTKNTEPKLISGTGNLDDGLEGLFNKDQLKLQTSLSSFTGAGKQASPTLSGTQ